ncbi:hypothetical protein CBM2634_B140073 [Cupriavidus taiwanensis]|uniref:Uncharacterized protein n=1 Tax=Cupriavidus taiwanensis TaxID=164546 RepID=A0A375J665_9BURK|nr:hypothetical protein CBM2634_B140073 [Cupriavidus taiwanensis]
MGQRRLDSVAMPDVCAAAGVDRGVLRTLLTMRSSAHPAGDGVAGFASLVASVTCEAEGGRDVDAADRSSRADGGMAAYRVAQSGRPARNAAPNSQHRRATL